VCEKAKLIRGNFFHEKQLLMMILNQSENAILVDMLYRYDIYSYDMSHKFEIHNTDILL
jgi:hypothetical protein